MALAYSMLFFVVVVVFAVLLPSCCFCSLEKWSVLLMGLMSKVK